MKKENIDEEREKNRKMCSNWYNEGFNDGKAQQKKEELEFLKFVLDRNFKIKEMIKKRVKQLESK